MNKFKYIICIIFGILLFLLLNTTNTFSIGNQYKLDHTNTGPTDSNVVLKRMYDIIVEGQNICIENEFEQCYITMDEIGGSCQINSLIGLYQIALGVGFSTPDRDYINSQGIYLGKTINIPTTYDYLTNRETMIPLLRHNHINSNVPIMTNNSNISEFKLNSLYPIALGFGYYRSPIFFEVNNKGKKVFTFGHNLLMYITNYAGLNNFITYLQSNGVDIHPPIYTDLVEKKRQLEALPNINIRNNGIVCIMIDFCQTKFYAVTEVSNPSTLVPNLFDASGNIPTENLRSYNDLWRVKILVEYQNKRKDPNSKISFTNALNGEIIEHYFRDLTPDNIFLSPTDDPRQFIDSILFHSFLHQDYVYNVGEMPNIKNRDDFLGFLDTQCRDRDKEPRCRNSDYYCHENFPVNNHVYDVCKQRGELNTPCKDSRPQCNDENLYCDTTDNICKQYGEQLGILNNRCRHSEPYCDSNLQCIYDFCRYDLLIYIDDVVFNSEDNSLLFDDGKFIYNTDWNDGDITSNRNITDFIIPIYLGKYTKTPIGGYVKYFTKERDLFIQYDSDSNNLVLIYGILEGNVFTVKGRKTINSDHLWHLGKHNNNDPNYITIYFNDGYITLSESSISDISTIHTINKLKNILIYLDLVLSATGGAVGGAVGGGACAVVK